MFLVNTSMCFLCSDCTMSADRTESRSFWFFFVCHQSIFKKKKTDCPLAYRTIDRDASLSPLLQSRETISLHLTVFFCDSYIFLLFGWLMWDVTNFNVQKAEILGMIGPQKKYVCAHVGFEPTIRRLGWYDNLRKRIPFQGRWVVRSSPTLEWSTDVAVKLVSSAPFKL